MPSSTAVALILKFNFAQQIRFAGWSETYELGYADLPTAITAQNQINAFIVDRLQCLGAGPILVEATLSAYVQPLHPGDAEVRRSTISLPIPSAPANDLAYNKLFNGTNPLTADFAPTVYYMSAQTSLTSNPVYKRSIWIAGLPDAADITTSTGIVDPGTLPCVQKFINDLQNSGATLGAKNSVSLKSVDRSAGNPIKRCTAWNLGPNTYTVPAHGFVENQPVVALGMRVAKGGSAPRGEYLVGTIIDANTITLQGAGVPSTPVKTGGFRARIFTFNPLALVQPQGFTKRDKGAPSGLSVGRRRKPATVRA